MKAISITLAEDMHVHSTFSDGLHSPDENIQQAESIGLKRICCVEHVRASSNWLPGFIRHIDRLKAVSTIKVQSGIETKILNQQGDLDMPLDVAGVDSIYVADHQFPLGGRVFTPKEIIAGLARGSVNQMQLINGLVAGTINALQRNPRIVLAHLFSILPKVGMSETQVPDELIEQIAHVARDTGAAIEIDERWKCPSLRTVEHFLRADVPVRCSTDSHRKEKIGQYTYTRTLLNQINITTNASETMLASMVWQ